MTRKCFYRMRLFIKEYKDVLQKKNWKIVVYAFYLVFCPNLASEIHIKATWNILNKCYTKNWNFFRFIEYYFDSYSYA